LYDHPGSECIRSIICENRDLGLGYERSRVHPGVNEMNCAPMFRGARLKGSRMGVESGEFREKRGVYVDQAPMESLNESRLQEDHKPGEGDEVGLGLPCGVQNGVFKRAKGVEVVAQHHSGRDIRFTRYHQTPGSGFVRDHVVNVVPTLVLYQGLKV
jgi:hypothetical protein